MNEFVKFECACDEGYDKGALKKTIENNIFTVYGNLNQKNSIVIRYHGELTEDSHDDCKEFNMFYFFNNAESEKKTIKLQKCAKCSSDCYCCTLDLDMNHALNFGFFDKKNNYEINSSNSFELEIFPDPISSLMQRYGFEKNTNLPTNPQAESNLFTLKNIFNNIKNYIQCLFKISSVCKKS